MTPEHQAIIALGGAIAVMFAWFVKKNASQDKQLEECNKDRAHLTDEVSRQKDEVLKQKDHIIGIWQSLAQAGIKPVINEQAKT